MSLQDTSHPTDFAKEESGADACAPTGAPATQSSMRPHCQKVDACTAKGAGAHCRACANQVINRDPVRRAKASASMTERLKDPRLRALQADYIRAAVAKSLNDPVACEARRQSGLTYGAKNIEATRSPEVRAKAGRSISNTKLRHIPPSLRDKYKDLVRRCGIPAVEAERMVKASAEQEARRQIEAVTAAMRAKQEREKAQAY